MGKKALGFYPSIAAYGEMDFTVIHIPIGFTDHLPARRSTC
jgi:hypothetical protein